ncbi:MAG TPA: chalcone isomerase family protein [Desulfopila sp.]|nr:chalcone isomerase family protein [Desulfopila sp.]
MKLFSTAVLTLLLIMVPQTPQAKPEGLVRSGEGDIRYLGLFHVYTAELFVGEGTRLSAVLDSQTSRCLAIRYTVDLSADDIVTGANAVLERQHTEQHIRPFRHLIDQLHSAYQDINEGDSYNLCYDSDTKTNTLYLNDQAVVSLPSSDLAALYFGIWLGENRPIDASLRSELLRGLTEIQ